MNFVLWRLGHIVVLAARCGRAVPQPRLAHGVIDYARHLRLTTMPTGFVKPWAWLVPAACAGVGVYQSVDGQAWRGIGLLFLAAYFGAGLLLRRAYARRWVENSAKAEELALEMLACCRGD